MDKVKEFLNDFQQNWDNSYWWADHQWLMYVLIFLLYYFFAIGMEVSRAIIRNRIEVSYASR